VTVQKRVSDPCFRCDCGLAIRCKSSRAATTLHIDLDDDDQPGPYTPLKPQAALGGAENGAGSAVVGGPLLARRSSSTGREFERKFTGDHDGGAPDPAAYIEVTRVLAQQAHTSFRFSYFALSPFEHTCI